MEGKSKEQLLAEAKEARSLTTPQAAAYCGLSPATLNSWRSEGKGPRFRKLGRAVRYQREDLDRWLDQQSFASTSEAGVANG